MLLNLERFYRACNPSQPLIVGNASDRGYYIDFADTQSVKIFSGFHRAIAQLWPDDPTCHLFTGNIGCGKSTELLRLKAELEQEDFHVVYFESTQVLDVTDVGITDILLAIVGQVSESLEAVEIKLKPGYFTQIFEEISDFLLAPIEFKTDTQLATAIAQITAMTKQSPFLRRRLRSYLELRTEKIVRSINQELLEPAKKELKARGKRGLVVLVDNLDRMLNRTLAPGRSQVEYLFIDWGEHLRNLNCHQVYATPLSLSLSNRLASLQDCFGGGVPKILVTVPVRLRSGEINNRALGLMRQMVLARAFPEVPPEQRLTLIPYLFDCETTLDRLCLVSGGHLRGLLAMLFDCLREQDPPFDRRCIETVIQRHRDFRLLAIEKEQWELIFQVAQQQNVNRHIEYQTLLQSLFVFEYYDRQGFWCSVNPLLEESHQFKSWQKHATQMLF